MAVGNVDDASVFFQDAAQSHAIGNTEHWVALLSDYLPQSPNGSILITSRNQDVACKLTGDFTSIIEVRPMKKDDALALLQKKLGSGAQDKALELIEVLDFMPLALTQAAPFIQQRAPRMSLSGYIAKGRRSDDDQAQLLQKDLGDSRRDSQAANSIIITWPISFKHIKKEHPTVARLLPLMSLFDRQGLPESLLHGWYGGDQVEDADFDDDIQTLKSFSLVQMNAGGREFEMHRLVQLSIKNWLDLSNELEPWKEIYVTLIDESCPIGDWDTLSACQELFPEAAMNSRPKERKMLEAWASVLHKASKVFRHDRTVRQGVRALLWRFASQGGDVGSRAPRHAQQPWITLQKLYAGKVDMMKQK